MSNNNNLLTEISALVLAVLLVLAGALLLYLGKISYDSAIFFFISALGLFGFNSAWKAPSPSQQSQFLSMLASAQAQPPVVIHNNIPATPAPPASAPAPQAQPVQQFATPAPFPYGPTSTFPQMPAMQP